MVVFTVIIGSIHYRESLYTIIMAVFTVTIGTIHYRESLYTIIMVVFPMTIGTIHYEENVYTVQERTYFFHGRSGSPAGSRNALSRSIIWSLIWRTMNGLGKDAWESRGKGVDKRHKPKTQLLRVPLCFCPCLLINIHRKCKGLY